MCWVARVITCGVSILHVSKSIIAATLAVDEEC